MCAAGHGELNASAQGRRGRDLLRRLQEPVLRRCLGGPRRGLAARTAQAIRQAKREVPGDPHGRPERRGHRRPPAAWLVGCRTHEVVNTAWIEDAIRVNSVHPNHSDAPFRELHHFARLFYDEMLQALAHGIEARLTQGTLRANVADLTVSLLDQPYRRE